MPQPFPQPRHPDDTPDGTPIIDPATGRAAVVSLDPARDHATSPLRRALLRAARFRGPFDRGGQTADPQPRPDPDQETPAP